MFEDIKKNLNEYVEINNEYFKIKLQEEKIKTRKIKHSTNDKDESQPEAIISGGQTFEETSIEKEIEKTLK